MATTMMSGRRRAATPPITLLTEMNSALMRM